ncbi:NADP oxidoreductase [Geobacter sp. FeAm09]|uniref:NADH-quinone oxidoreductase subunit B family protein n=1 Tax=Geobacter sp. FeAm09 TaxID=2597769 RepID=UPI0011EF377D|nr:NADP oxidoreductase [Geobacter sp. FeAm09]QEM69213.1 NADP oxidoreductase [Geobacter sp. FeAm09]
MTRPRLATVWLSGCSGCHMSLLNLHGDLLELLGRCDLVYSPLADIKEYPRGVDIALVEGAVANEENREMAGIVRSRTACVVSLGDCAVNGNVSALRNPLGREGTLERVYGEAAPEHGVARLLPTALPLHQVIGVDLFLPGCPPAPERIRWVLTRLLEGRPVALPPEMLSFG